MASPIGSGGGGSAGGGDSDSDGLDLSASGPPATHNIALTPPPPEEQLHQHEQQQQSEHEQEAASTNVHDAAAATPVVTPAALATPASSSSVATATAPMEPVPRISFFAFYFRYATASDVLMMTLGIVGGIITGSLIPFFQFLFGRMMDSLNTGANIVEAVSEVAIVFAYMSAVAFVFGHLQVWGWSVYGERQVARIRGLYVQVRWSNPNPQMLFVP